MNINQKTYTYEQETQCESKIKKIGFALLIMFILAMSSVIFARPLTFFNSQPQSYPDLSGNGNNAIVYGDVRLTKDGVTFDTENYSYTKTVQTFSLTNDFTIGYWYYCYNPVDYNWYGVQLGSSYGNGFIVALSRSLTVETNGTLNIIDFSFSANQWKYNVATHNSATKTITTYTDGVQIDSDTYTTSLSTTPQELYCNDNNQIAYMYLKNVSFWDKILSTNEIQTLYNAGRNASMDCISTNGLKLFYSFDNDPKPVTINDRPVGVK